MQSPRCKIPLKDTMKKYNIDDNNGEQIAKGPVDGGLNVIKLPFSLGVAVGVLPGFSQQGAKFPNKGLDY